MTRPLETLRSDRRLVDRVVEDRVTADDRAHAATCESCGPVLSRAMRFDDELRRSARGLVTEQLPYGVLDPDLAPRLVGDVLADAPRGAGPREHPRRRGHPRGRDLGGHRARVSSGRGTQPPTAASRSPARHSGRPPTSSGRSRASTTRASGPRAADDWPERPARRARGRVCLSPKSIESASAKIVPVETGDGDVVEVTIRGELYGTDTVTSRGPAGGRDGQAHDPVDRGSGGGRAGRPVRRGDAPALARAAVRRRRADDLRRRARLPPALHRRRLPPGAAAV